MNHTKRMIAPIIITMLMVLYYVGIAVLLLCVEEIPFGVKALMIGIPLALCRVMIGVLIGRDITQGFKTIVGGKLKAYNEMMNDARALATKRMVAEAEELGADAIVIL